LHFKYHSANLGHKEPFNSSLITKANLHWEKCQGQLLYLP
jgi:hypothetical protein